MAQKKKTRKRIVASKKKPDKKGKRVAQKTEVQKDEIKEVKEEKKMIFAREKYLKGSPRKARLVVDLVRGKNAEEAVYELDFVHKKSARVIKKAIESAIANAVHNFEMDKKKLFIGQAYIDEAPTFKRGRAGSRGRYKRILKRNYHVTIGVIER